jgi:DNA repair exonuclease SbcCD ATPase subunit
MGEMSRREKEKEKLQQAIGAMYDKLWQWREEHPQASFDEIAAQVTPQRREVMAELLKALACQHGSGQVAEGQVCPGCGRPMEYKGEPKREIEHYLEGETELKRAYYYCRQCESGLFPPG